jgi:signal transduction histidine kinase
LDFGFVSYFEIRISDFPMKLGEAATHLPWLSPCAASLVALARAPAATAWESVRLDPGAVLLVVRQTLVAETASNFSSFPCLLRAPAILEGALRHLRYPCTEARRSAGPALFGAGTSWVGFVDWNTPETAPIYQAALLYACLSRKLAQRTQRCDVENAWVAGLLAPLGWLALAAVHPRATADCLKQIAAEKRHSVIAHRQVACWGLDHGAIVRRLVRRWQLPVWLGVSCGHLALPVEVAQTLGAEPELFRIVQLAVRLAQRHDTLLGLPVGEDGQLASSLNLKAADLEAVTTEARSAVQEMANVLVCHPPEMEPLLPDLLRLALENRRLNDHPVLGDLESDVDQLHRALEEQRAAARERLQAQKLAALAEFAAGAGHEINNPLAVISGQAQYLLKQWPGGNGRLPLENGHATTEHRPSGIVERSLQTIISQTRRIHELLNDLMQFARPPQPRKEWVDVPELIRDVVATLEGLAGERRVRLVLSRSEAADPSAIRNPQPAITVYADPRQLHSALSCLMRNAIEAAACDVNEERWAGVRLETLAFDRLDLIVEDSGPGPAAGERDHLFDPFYSGRKAGRGRGLGLPTAWRLARQHGGDVRFEYLPQGPTRFILCLPVESSAPLATAS